MADWRWLESTKKLQEESFGIDASKMASSPEYFADYIMTNHSALIIELSEFMAEIQWKPWAGSRGDVLNRTLAVKELVDVAHFLANLAVALGVTDEEWEGLYRAKQEVNARRQIEGYDGVADKCPHCRRSFDDAPPQVVEGEMFCSGCFKFISNSEESA